MLGAIRRNGKRSPLLPSSLNQSRLAPDTPQTTQHDYHIRSQPPTSEVKVVLEHFHSDPNANLMNLFKYFVLVWLLGCGMVLVSWLSQQKHARLLEQRAAAALGADFPLPTDAQWGSTIKLFLWAVFGGPLFIFIILAVLAHWIGRVVKEDPSLSWNYEDNPGLPVQSSGSKTRSSGAWELEGVDVYSGIFWTTS